MVVFEIFLRTVSSQIWIEFNACITNLMSKMALTTQ